ncbi:MAG: hypothetical protein RIQ54_644 [Candidatus Parcubacteria bacterium]|jgi:hypothetical protein
MNIIEEVKKLNFPIGQYVIVGSGPMAVRGLRDAHDIDIVVTRELFETCKANGWEAVPWTYPEKIGQIYLRKNYVELYLDVNCADFNPTTYGRINTKSRDYRRGPLHTLTRYDTI